MSDNPPSDSIGHSPSVKPTSPGHAVGQGDGADPCVRCLDEPAHPSDWILAWVAILLALMFGCSTVADSQVLGHIAAGRAVWNHGGFPSGVDTLSASAEQRPWVHTDWLADLALFGVDSLGGDVALTFFKTCGAGLLAILLLGLAWRCQRWWAPLLVGITVLACLPQLECGPELFTLLGITMTLRQLHAYRRESITFGLWWLVPLFALWANLDPRMFLGLWLLVLFGLGELIGELFQRPGFEDPGQRQRYWLVTLTACAAACLNPFTWRSPLGFIQLYGRVDPAFREYYARDFHPAGLAHFSLFSDRFPHQFDAPLLAALFLYSAASWLCWLNRKCMHPSDVMAWIGFGILGLFASREWPLAAIISTGVALENANCWAASAIRQRRWHDEGNAVFAQVGRAVTVAAFSCLAVLWLTGRLRLDDGRAPGLGHDPLLAMQVDSLQRLLADPVDGRIFNFHAQQGDLLLYLGFTPFIDHRLDLFAGDNANHDETASRNGGSKESGKQPSTDLIELHDATRHALRQRLPTDDPAARALVWRGTLDAARITQVLPRLLFPRPDYRTYGDLASSPNWVLTGLDAAGAVFTRVPVANQAGDAQLQRYLAKHRLNFPELAFRALAPAQELVPENGSNPRRSSPSQRNSLSERNSPSARGRQSAAGGESAETAQAGPVTQSNVGSANAWLDPGRDENRLVTTALEDAEHLAELWSGNDPSTAQWPQPIAWSDRFWRRTTVDASLVRGRHYLHHLKQAYHGSFTVTIEEGIAIANLAVRDLSQAVRRDPQNPTAAHSLGEAYEQLGFFETLMGRNLHDATPPQRRTYQALAAYGRVLMLLPNDPATHLRLMELYGSSSKFDLLERSIARYETQTGTLPPEIETADTQGRSMVNDLRSGIQNVRKNSQRRIKAGEPPLAVAQAVWQQGYTLRAIEILKLELSREATAASDSSEPPVPDLNTLYFLAQLYLEAAEPQAAEALLTRIVSVSPSDGPSGKILPEWREIAALTALAVSRQELAKLFWQEERNALRESQWLSAFAASTFTLGADVPGTRAVVAMNALVFLPGKADAALLNVALSELELGQFVEARQHLTRLHNPACTVPKPLAVYYLSMLEGEPRMLVKPHAPPDTHAEVDFSQSDRGFDHALMKRQQRFPAPRRPLEAPRPLVP